MTVLKRRRHREPLAASERSGGGSEQARSVRSELNRVVSDLLVTVSHELMTPLTVIRGNATTLARPDLDIPESTRKAMVGHIVTQAERLQLLLQQLLTARRLETGELRPDTRSVAPDEILRRAASEAAVRSRVRIRMVIDPSAPRVLVDPELAWDVLDRIFENAIQHGMLNNRIDAGCRQVGGGVRFWVHDDGGSIPPEEHCRIFERFYAAPRRADHRDGGAGLGLYICRRLVQLMGGRVWLTSSRDAGTTFFVWLPASDQTTPEQQMQTAHRGRARATTGNAQEARDAEAHHDHDPRTESRPASALRSRSTA